MVVVLEIVMVEERITENNYLETEAAARIVLGVSVLLVMFFLKNQNAHLVFQK